MLPDQESALASISNAFESANLECSDLRESLSFAKNDLTQAKADAEAAMNSALAAAATEKDALISQIATLTAQVEQLTREDTSSGLKAEVEGLRAQNKQLGEEVSRLNAGVNPPLMAQIADLTTQLTARTAERDTALATIEEIRRDLSG